MIKIKKIVHNDVHQIGIYFGFNEELKTKSKSIGARWSQTHRCWYVPYNKQSYQQLKDTFETIEIISEETNNRATEPAAPQHEPVRIATNNGDLLPVHSEEHKGNGPEPKALIEYMGINGEVMLPYSIVEYLNTIAHFTHQTNGCFRANTKAKPSVQARCKR